MRCKAFGIGLGLFLSWSAASASAEPQDSAAPSSAIIHATPAMWTIHGPKGTVYMLGSFHALPKNVEWQTPEITKAIQSADSFVFEVPMDADTRSQVAAIFGRNLLLPLSISLPSLFDDEMRGDYIQIVQRYHPNLQALVYMRPWAASNYLEGVAGGITGLFGTEGVDNKVYAIAKARGVKDFRALETDQLQLGIIMGDGNIRHELETLRATFKRLENKKPESGDKLLQAWYRGDVKTIAAYGPDSTDMPPQTRKVVLEDRNHNWVPEIEAMLNQRRTFFITVGAAHLVGKIGVPAQLQAAGYRVEGPGISQSAPPAMTAALRLVPQN